MGLRYTKTKNNKGSSVFPEEKKLKTYNFCTLKKKPQS